ncbi:MFS transporter, DHA1 family, bicyclomycin/chloramphenicol resistance protein [Streptomyces zhaozhouensis]|uniref:MFS transporter, DHA1 family, bicyclomycin/chloramphenicol resistance protein n=1 Tax=Streptomyces zhaozhouensis TaxID=1300267 RepID=A0A286DKB9_9ACTN|nr:Bcr/CflA family multidrug efflux MFS transporter [Streptomyces zhaozhouensis]SOD59069.1 MFS transporter, DHA1 family, bicyclomycin/chloramphenicol resistance protein [Streptomyces zhaozhouensis]
MTQLGQSPTAVPGSDVRPPNATEISTGATPGISTPSLPPPLPTPQLSKRRKAGLLIVLILGSLSALPPLSIDMYLPALPEVADSLGTGAATIQLTLTACLLGLGLGQLIVGPMSDQLGRRWPLIAGMACYVVASVACAFAPTVEVLTACRFVQGLAGSAGVVIARAVVRDLYSGVAMARFFSTLMLVSGVAPILAPVFGGQLMRVTDWRGIFLVLAGTGVVLIFVVIRWLPETLPPERRQSGGVPAALRAMGGLFKDRVFTGHLLVGSLVFAALFAYVAASPFVVQEIYGASPQTYSMVFMANSVALVLMSQVNGKILVGRVPVHRTMSIGLGMITLSAVALLVMTTGVFGEANLLAISVGLFFLMGSMPLVLPNANSEGLDRAPHAAGAASALLGAFQFFIGAVASPLVGVAGEHTAVPMAVVQLVAVLAGALCYVTMCRPKRSAARPTLPG